VTLTRQGIPNLDKLGTPPKRGHVGRSQEVERESCAHLWDYPGCENSYCFILSDCTCPAKRCRSCGREE
jgi:hypothetical protein